MASNLQLDSTSQLAITLEHMHVSPITPPSLYNYDSDASTPRSASTSSRSASPVAQSKPPRPQNAFFLYRQHYIKTHKSEETRQNLLSKEVGATWNVMSVEARQPWIEAAEKELALHKLRYPNYTYSPARKGTCSPKTRSPKGDGMSGSKRPAAPSRRTPKTRSTEVGSRGKRSRVNNTSVEAEPSFADYPQSAGLSRRPSPFREAPGQFTLSMIPQAYSMDHPLNALQIAQPEDDMLFKPVVWAEQYSTSPMYMPPFPQPEPLYQYEQSQVLFDPAFMPFPYESGVYNLTSYECFGGMLPAPQDYNWNGQFSSTEYYL